MTVRTTAAPLLDADPGVKDVALVPAHESGGAVEMFERLARDPNASVDKIERLMALWERGEARKSETLWNAAMADAQEGMRPVAADAWNPQTKSRYASYEALDTALRPVYTKCGFGLTFNTDDGAPVDVVRVVCKVTHRGGHAELYRLDMPADGKGAKGGDVMTKTHATGAALSYGMRYLLKMIFNIAVGEGDDDGNSAGAKATPPKPPGYDAWWTALESVAGNGLRELEDAWGKSKADFKQFTVNHNKDAHNDLKTRAAKVRR